MVFFAPGKLGRQHTGNQKKRDEICKKERTGKSRQQGASEGKTTKYSAENLVLNRARRTSSVKRN